MNRTGHPLDSFFTSPNRIRLDHLEEEAARLLRSLLERLEQQIRTVLPALVGPHLRWYGITPTYSESRILFEELRAWIGPPLTLGVEYVEPSSSDEMDMRVLQLATGGRVLRVDVADNMKKTVRRQVLRLTEVWESAPIREAGVPHATGRVLRHFYEALAVGNRMSVESALEELKARSLLSPTNLRFLRVQMLGELGTADELLSDPSVAELKGVARPPIVSSYLAQALEDIVITPMWTKNIGVMEIAKAAQNCWSGTVIFKSQVLSNSGARCLALSELLVSEPRSGIINYLDDEWGKDPLIAAVLHEFGTIAVRSRRDTILALYHHGEYESVVDAVEAAGPVHTLVSIALQAAFNLGDAESASRVLQLIEALGDDDRTALLANAVERNLCDQLQERIDGTRVPDGWSSWLEGDWPDRADLLREWCEYWDVTVFSDVEISDNFALLLIDTLNDERRARVRNGLPVLISKLRGDFGLQAGVMSVAVSIFQIMLDSAPGRLERELLLRLLEDLLISGCSKEYYTAILRDLRIDVDRLGWRDTAWIAGLLDVLLAATVLDKEACSDFFNSAFGQVLSWGDRIDEVDCRLFERLFADAGLSYSRPPVQDHGPESAVRLREFTRVGIYSIAESTARTAARWIIEEWPDAEVSVSNAHVNTPELQTLVRASDILLVQTSHAKHAATNAIRSSADPDKIVWVDGRGATSLFRALANWALGEA